jgi:superfamily II DNA or RNA helicase
LEVDHGGPWSFTLVADEDGDGLVVRGAFARGAERLPLAQSWIVFRTDVAFLGGKVIAIEPIHDFAWTRGLCAQGTARIPAGDRDAFLAFAAERGDVDLPDSLRLEEVRAPPRFLARFGRPDVKEARVRVLAFSVYGERDVSLGAAGRAVFDAAARRVHVRDAAAERAGIAALAAAGVRFTADGTGLDLPIAKLAQATRALLGAGWRVEAVDRRFRGATATRSAVVSGMDWFDLRAEVDFDGEPVPLPRLLAALRRGESFIELGDGSLGVLPDEWLERWGAVVDLGKANGDTIRFARTQAALLDALVGATDHAALDESFAKLRERIAAGFRASAEPQIPATFTGTLRDYQRAGVAWMEMLAEAGFGGCLADDMGLGKTVQVLARLAARAGNGPSLVVAPRSLVFNWRDEAARFVPSLRVVDHSGAARKRGQRADFADVDLVLTTYGTLRRDAEDLAAVSFDYVILDEAQAIKNDTTSNAKAARSLQARHRLALSGTPIENHLGELWSLFEFLSPGMLGRSSAFKRWSTSTPDADDRALLGRALRPFLLRRTKSEVAKELPDRIEQTIACELGPEQRALYDELRKHYRKTLLAKARKAPGEPLPTMNVLEALLRLRQAACHPGLVDRARSDEKSAKVDALFAQLASILEEGHKAIVFSQFTSLLDLVMMRLIRQKVGYERLDGGSTARQRERRVERFQEEDDCRVFLVSLKAGGTGLNLTAATYVFLLDPWWNPAAEAQAIDRAHRIGQTRTVLAYRLVAKGTVEERVLELQATKRQLAESILEPGAWSVVHDLKLEDLDLLLS